MNGSLIIRKEHKMRAYGKRVIKKIFGSKQSEVKEELINWHYGKLKNLYQG
jgi:predicted acetyltransferase